MGDTARVGFSRWPARRWLGAFALAAGLAVAAVGLVYQEQVRLVAANGWVAHTQDVLLQVERSRTLLNEAEASQRGFLLTGRAEYRAPFVAAAEALEVAIDRIATLTADNPAQQARVITLRRLWRERLALMQHGAGLADGGRFAEAQQFVAGDAGRQASVLVRQQLAMMESTELRLLDERNDALRAKHRHSLLTIVALALLNLVFLGFGFFDLMRRKQTEIERDRLFALSRDMLCIARTDGFFKRVNPAFTTTLGYSAEEIVARPFVDFVHPDDRAATLAEVSSLARGVPTVNFANRYQCRDGSYKWLQWLASPDPATGVIFAGARDMTEIKERERQLVALTQSLETANRELDRLSSMDELTGVPNRRGLNQTLDAAFERARRLQEPLAVLMIDVDYFKKYNDTYGHPAGDHCLAQVAAVLKSQLRSSDDVVARYGGEEFAVVLPATDGSGALIVARRVVDAVRSLGIPHRGSAVAGHVTVSVGLATMASSPIDVRELLADADGALYQAKQHGRDRIHAIASLSAGADCAAPSLAVSNRGHR